MKRRFLILYDYGTGGLWDLIMARSESEIREKFPELQVIGKKPEWMTLENYKELLLGMPFDIDNPTGWLLTLFEERKGAEKGSV